MQSPSEIYNPNDNQSGNPFSNGLISESAQIAEIRKFSRPGEWERDYLDALSRGHTKVSAAGVAGISPRTAYARASNDSNFFEQEEIAYCRGTARLYGIAVDRVTDPVNPSDNVLKHLLGVRGVAPKNQLEISGSLNVGKANQEQSIDLEQLPVYAKRLMLICLNGGELSSDLQKLMNREMTQLELQIAERQMREQENRAGASENSPPIEAMKVISK